MECLGICYDSHAIYERIFINLNIFKWKRKLYYMSLRLIKLLLKGNNITRED